MTLRIIVPALVLAATIKAFGQSHEFSLQLESGENFTLPLAEIQRIEFSGIISVEDETVTARSFQLDPSFPNPFNPSTTISYQLSTAAEVHVQIVDMRGAHVATLIDESQQAGLHSLVWHGTNQAGLPVSSGIYLLSVQAGEARKTDKLLLVK